LLIQNAQIKDFYDANYKVIVKEDFNMTFSGTSKAHYLANTGLLKKMNFVVTEKVSNSLHHQYAVDIEKIK
jgi:hypothetical protein